MLGAPGGERLSIASALAAQGEVEGLRLLVESLRVKRGHLGFVYLRKITRDATPEPPSEWDFKAWAGWLDRLDPLRWRDFNVGVTSRESHSTPTQRVLRVPSIGGRATMPDVAPSCSYASTGGAEDRVPEYRSTGRGSGFLLSKTRQARVF
jgi:hypothetical protein